MSDQGRVDKAFKFFPYIAFASLIGIVFASGMNRSSLNRTKGLYTVSEGVTTCGSRINQSYVSAILGDKGSTHLSPEFMQMTEDCLGDVIGTFSEHFEYDLAQIGSSLNSLGTLIHKMHISLSNDSAGGVDVLYNSIESTLETINQSLYGQRSEIRTNLSYLNILFWFSASTLFLTTCLLVFKTIRRRSRNEEIDVEAESISAKFTGLPNPAQVESIMKKALSANGLEHSLKLFMDYHSDVLEGKLNFSTAASGKRRKPNQNNPTTVSNNHLNLEIIKLDRSLVRVLDIYRSKFTQHGITLEANVDEKVKLWATQDGLEQIFYNVLGYSFESCKNDLLERRVRIDCKVLGGIAIIAFTNSGFGFSEDYLETPLNILKDKKLLTPELSLVYELIKDMGGKIGFKNLLDTNGEIKGSNVELIFKFAGFEAGIGRKKVDVVKGSKRELLERFGTA